MRILSLDDRRVVLFEANNMTDDIFSQHQVCSHSENEVSTLYKIGTEDFLLNREKRNLLEREGYWLRCGKWFFKDCLFKYDKSEVEDSWYLLSYLERDIEEHKELVRIG